MKKPPSYRGRQRHSMVEASMLSSTAAILIASLLLVLFQFLLQRSALVDDMQVQARLIADSSGAPLLFADTAAANNTLAALSSSPNIDQAGIFDSEDKVLASWPAGRGPQEPWLRPAEPARFGLQFLDIVQQVEVEGNPIGYVALRVRLQQFYHRLLIFVVFTLVVGLASLAAAYLLLSRMRRKVVSAEADLNYLAHTDPVTDLPNRHAFNAALARILWQADEANGEAALLLLDLDNFKGVNDTLGHHSGDLLLHAVAKRLLGCLRREDVLCRIGGDEFAVILSSQGVFEDPGTIARKLLAALARPVQLEQHELYVTVSIGISTYPRDAGDQHTLARNADSAMYEAKAKGKNGYAIFHAGMNAAAQRRMLIENGLRRALERDELTLHYQPQSNLATGQVTGMEALLRWSSPELGMVSPAEFIPVAEQSGLIQAIGLWVLRCACAQMAQWSRNGLGQLTISVNLSARQMHNGDLLRDVRRILDATGLQPAQLELEITESFLMEKVEENVVLLRTLRASGIQLAIDDFGTGYSSFAYLKRFPIDRLKIDRTFVQDIGRDGENGAIVTAIISMAHELDMQVVAEGVEAEAQRQFLLRAQCDIIQGYHVARPMPADVAEAFLRARLPVPGQACRQLAHLGTR